MDKQRVLFVCTGNYYRSRFAEAVFNHHAERIGLAWRAFSRGFRIRLARGPLAREARRGLEERKIALDLTTPEPIAMLEPDLARASKVIALKRAEHLPLMIEAFPHWAGRIDYWSIHDIEDEAPESALSKIEEKVVRLIQVFSESQALNESASDASEF